MKVIAVVLLALVALSNALPSEKLIAKDAIQDRFIDGIVAGVVEDIAQTIRDEGYDPFYHPGIDFGYALPVPVLFTVVSHVKDISVVGLSNIVINRINFGLLTNRLDLDISLPRISISLNDFRLAAQVLGEELDASANFELVITQPRIAGSIHVNIGVITGVFVREINLAFTLGGIRFDGQVNALGYNWTNAIQDIINQWLPTRLVELQAEVNELVNIIAWQVVDQIL